MTLSTSSSSSSSSLSSHLDFFKNEGIASSAAISLLHFFCQFELPSQSDLWQIGRHFPNARDENNKAKCCDGYQQHVAFIGCIHISTPNTTPVHT
jgi:hypothetical protein